VPSSVWYPVRLVRGIRRDVRGWLRVIRAFYGAAGVPVAPAAAASAFTRDNAHLFGPDIP
jgi:hypothetical protein